MEWVEISCARGETEMIYQKNSLMLDIIGQIFWYGILATPIITFLIVQKMKKLSLIQKIISGVLITAALALVFYAVAMAIVLRDGLGPT